MWKWGLAIKTVGNQGKLTWESRASKCIQMQASAGILGRLEGVVGKHFTWCPVPHNNYEDKNMYHSLWSVAKKVDIFVYRYGCSPMKSHDPNQSIRRPRQTQGGARQGIIPLTLVSLWAQQQQQLFLALEAVWLQQHDSSTTAATSSRQPQAAAGSSRQQQAAAGISRQQQTQADAAAVSATAAVQQLAARKIVFF